MTEEWVLENISDLNLIKGSVNLEDFCNWCENYEDEIVGAMYEAGIAYAQEACDCCPEEPDPEYDCDNFEEWIINVAAPEWPGLGFEAGEPKFCQHCDTNPDIQAAYPGEPGCGCCPGPTGKWSCIDVEVDLSSETPGAECIEDAEGVYNTEVECQNAMVDDEISLALNHYIFSCPNECEDIDLNAFAQSIGYSDEEKFCRDCEFEPGFAEQWDECECCPEDEDPEEKGWKCEIEAGEEYGLCAEVEGASTYTTEQECIDAGCECPPEPPYSYMYCHPDNPGYNPTFFYWNQELCQCMTIAEPEERGCLDESAANYGVCCDGDPDCVPTLHDQTCCDPGDDHWDGDTTELLSCCELEEDFDDQNYPSINWQGGEEASIVLPMGGNEVQVWEEAGGLQLNPIDYGELEFTTFGDIDLATACASGICQDIESAGSMGGSWKIFPYCACCEEIGYSSEGIVEVFETCDPREEEPEDEEQFLYYGCSDCMEGEGNTYTSLVTNEGTDWLCGPEVIEVWLPNYQGPSISTNSSNGFMYAGYPGQWLGYSESYTPEEVLEEQCTGTIGVVVNCRQCYDEWETNGNWMLPYCDNYDCPWPDDYTPDPDGAATVPTTADLSVDTPGAPQPEDYPGGGTDPQYLRDKAAFIKKYTSGNVLRESTVDRFKKLAGIKKKKK